jgi:hypothetical protein
MGPMRHLARTIVLQNETEKTANYFFASTYRATYLPLSNVNSTGDACFLHMQRISLVLNSNCCKKEPERVA